MKKWIIFALTSCIVISLVAFIQSTDLEKVIDAVQRVGYNIVWLLVLTGIAYLFGTLNWKYCLGNQYQSISTIRLFLIRHVGETVSLFNPASIVGGDSVKVMMLGDYGIEKKQVMASVILSRLILIASQLSLFVLTAFALMIQHSGISLSSTSAKVLSFPPLSFSEERLYD